MAQEQKVRIRDNDQAPQIFGDHFIGMHTDGNTVGITVGCLRAVPEKTGSPSVSGGNLAVVVTGRMILTPKAAADLADMLVTTLSEIKKRASGGGQASGSTSH